MKKLLTFSAIAAAAGLIGLWVKNRRPKDILMRQTVVEMLQKVDQQSYMILCQMATCVAQVLKQSPTPPDPEQLKAMFESPQSNQINNIGGFPDLFKQLYTALYEQFNTTEEQFEYSIQNGYPNDAEIQFYRKRLADDFHKAMLGVTPNIDRAKPVELPAEKTLGITSTILNEQLRVMREGLQQLKTAISVKQALQLSESIITQFKQEIYKKQGLMQFGEQPDKLLEFAVVNYRRLDGKFKSEYDRICADYQSEMNKLIDQHSHLLTA